MRPCVVFLVLVAALALICSGCGKTQEQQKMESAMNAEVMALQKDVKSNLAGFTDLQARLDATLRMHEELVKKYSKKMKGHNADDISAAKQGLGAAKGEAENVLKTLTAYDKKMDHDQAMPKLKKDKESLIKIKDVVLGAAGTATAAIANHEKMKTTLTAKAPKKSSSKKAAPKKTKK